MSFHSNRRPDISVSVYGRQFSANNHRGGFGGHRPFYRGYTRPNGNIRPTYPRGSFVHRGNPSNFGERRECLQCREIINKKEKEIRRLKDELRKEKAEKEAAVTMMLKLAAPEKLNGEDVRLEKKECAETSEVVPSPETVSDGKNPEPENTKETRPTRRSGRKSGAQAK